MRSAIMWFSAALLAAAGGCISPSLDAEPVLTGPDSRAVLSDQIRISWGEAPGAVSRYVVERRFVPDDFREDQRLPAYQRATRIVLGPDSPELTVLEIRVRAEPNGANRVSNVISVHLPLRAPTFRLCTSCPRPPQFSQFTVQWQNRSRVADQFVLERQVSSTSEWTVIPVPTGANQYVDSDLAQWTDGASYQYRLTAVKGQERSSPVFAATSSAPLFPPSILSTTLIPGAVRITFQNQSRSAVGITIYRRWQGGSQNSIASGSAPVVGQAVYYDDRSTNPGVNCYTIVAYLDRSSSFSPEMCVTVPTLSSSETDVDGLANQKRELEENPDPSIAPPGWLENR